MCFVAIDRWNAHLHEQVFGLRCVNIDDTTDASFKKAEINTEVPLCGFLPSQGGVGHWQVAVSNDRLRRCITWLQAAAEGVEERSHATLGLVGIDGRVACHTDAKAKFQLADPAYVLEEIFLLHIPA